MRTITILTIALAASGTSEGLAQQVEPADSLEARVWLDRGEDPVVQRGDDVRVYYRTSADAFAAIFRLDTDGVISMLLPQHPDAVEPVRGGRDFRLIFPSSPTWRVDEDPGVGYFFIVASPVPFDFSLLDFDDQAGWDLTSAGASVYEDPYVAIDDYIATILPDWETVPYALDFLTYNVGDTHEYPRFLCYDCHGYQSYAAWNPYSLACSSYRVVIWDDPYFYPRYRYSGTRVVFARPFGPRPRYGVVTRIAGTTSIPLIKSRAAPPRRVVEYKESPRARPFQPRNPVPRAGGGATGRVSPTVLPNRPGARAGATRSARPTTSRVAPPRASARTGARQPATSVPRSRPTLQRRPSAPSARLPARGSAGATNRGTTSRGTATGRPSAAPGRSAAPSRSVRPRRSQPRVSPPRATPQRAPTRAVPRSRPSTGTRSAPRRPPTSARSRPPNRPTVRSAPRAPNRARPTPRRRPGRGRGG